MSSTLPPMDQLGKLFSRKNCWMIADLSKALGYAMVSVRRFLTEIGYFRSYSHNGKWYTLQSIPHFNKDGIWLHHNIGFSKHGNLPQTIASLLNRSPQGYCARDLGAKLHLPCHAVLTNLYKAGKVDRVKFTKEYVYLSMEEHMNRRQRERQKEQTPKKPPKPLSAEAAVFVLVEFIKHPQLSFEEISKALQKTQNITIHSEDIAQFFQKHGLKKTPNSPNLGQSLS